ncbi:hypothetical protein CSPAE12_06650 [Colletotrichum incanum]|nr:hypothetical protein CSPAE12_06650 [Colletotrichum incanum]
MYIADNELASWVTLLAALQKMENSSRHWQSKYLRYVHPNGGVVSEGRHPRLPFNASSEVGALFRLISENRMRQPPGVIWWE